ncbi:MAG: hypothetical protein ACRDZ6_03740 [Acidimicrobiales bacterium]
MTAMSTPEPTAGAVPSRSDDLVYEQRCEEDSSFTGARLLIGLSAFAFASLAFTYFYLRSANNFRLWRPGGVTAPTDTGAAIFGVTLGVAVLYYYGLRRMRARSLVDWEVAGWTAVGGGLLALGLQIWELTSLPFFPGSSGYASCFIGWAGMNIALLLGVTYWMETLLARSLRLRRALREEGGGGPAGSQLPPARSFRISAENASVFLWYAAGVELLFWILFYAL